MSVQVKASLWYTICNFLQKGISLIFVPIYVKMLTTAEYGEWSVFQSWRDILIIFASLNLFAGVYTKTLIDKRDERDRYTSSMQGLGTVVSFGMLVLYGLTHKWCNSRLGLTTPYVLLLFVYFIVYPGLAFWTARQRVEYKYKPMILVTMLISILTPLLSVALLKYTNLRTNALILGYLIVQCSIGLVFYIYQFWKGRCFFQKDYWHYALAFNIPLVPHYLSLIILNQSDRIMIKHFCGDSEAGIYSFAYQIASTINVLISAINGSRVPWTYERLKERVYERLKIITNALTILLATIVLLISILSPEIIKILGTSDYQIAVYVIPIVTLGVFYTFIYDLYASIEFYYGSTRYVMYASITGAILNIVLNLIFIPMYGFIAAAYTTLACYIVFMIMHYFFSQKVLREQNIHMVVYENRVVFLISALITFACFGCMATFNHVIIRIIMVLIIFGGVVVFRNRIKDLLVEMKNRGAK